MRNAWSWLGLNLGKRAGTVSVIGLVITVALGLGITQLKFVTSNASYLNPTDKAQIENQNYEKHFGGDPIVTMFTMKPGTTIDNLFTNANVAEFEKVQRQLKTDPSVFSAITPLDAVQLEATLSYSADGNPTDSMAGKLLVSAYERDPSASGKALRQKNIVALAAGESAIPTGQRVLSNPKWVHFLAHNVDGSMRASSATFLPNNGHAAMIVFLKGGLSIDQESAAATSVQDIVNGATFQNTTTLTTGVPALLRTINNYLKHGMLTLGAIAAVVMVIILLLLFNVRWRLLPFAIVVIGLIWGFGLTGYFGIPLTLSSVAGLPVLLGVGIDYAIQMHSRVEEEVILDRATHPIQATARNLGPALLVVTFDAVFAFAALLFAKVPMIRQFGGLLIVSVIAVCVCSIIGPLAILGIREYKSPTTGGDFSIGRLGRLTAWLGSVPAKAAVPFALAAVVIFAAGLAVEGHITLQTDPLQWVDPGSQTVKDANTLKAGTGTDNDISALIHTNAPWSDQTVAYVSAFSDEQVHNFPDLLFPGTGMVNLVYEFISLPGASAVPPLGSQVEQVYGVAPEDIRHTTVAGGGSYLGVVFESKTSTLEALQPVVDQMQTIHPPAGITVAPGGIAVVGVGLLDNLSKSRSLLTYLAIIFVGLFLALRLRSVVRSLLSLVPVMVAVGSVTLIAWALSLKLSPMTAISGPLVIAVCTEFTSLILLRFVEERGRRRTPKESMQITASRTGRAFIVSGLTAVAGVVVIASSPWPLLRGFGTIVGLNVLVALACALVILPPILVWAEEGDRNWVSRHLAHFEDEAAADIPTEPAREKASIPQASGPPAVAGGPAAT
ncbi:MAG: efflux RND transporter permease subunit [Acidimicrobiales bacterium]